MAAALAASPAFNQGGVTAPGFNAAGSFFGGGGLVLIGDQGPPVFRYQTTPTPTPPGLPRPFPPSPFPKPPPPGRASALVPSVRSFKIAENQSPQPQDRIYYSFNYFNNVNQALNLRFQSPVNGLKVYREIWGVEKTFDDGWGSIGFRLPLNTMSANTAVQGNFAKPGGTSTSLGDLTIYGKYILKLDPATGSLLSAGIAVTPPTGPNNFAGAKYISAIHSTSVQPFIGYIWNWNRFYLHGFSALDTPTSLRDVTLVYNDVGIGYFLIRETDPDIFLTALAPTFEVHVNTPLTHRDWANSKDPAGTPDSVNLTYGLNAEFFRRGVLTFGFVTPVTGPRPFNYEVIALFNLYFGNRVRRPSPPILGG
jgi:hypothetical protein